MIIVIMQVMKMILGESSFDSALDKRIIFVILWGIWIAWVVYVIAAAKRVRDRDYEKDCAWTENRIVRAKVVLVQTRDSKKKLKKVYMECENSLRK